MKFLLAFSFLLLSMGMTSSNEWELRVEEDGIKVYTRKSETSILKEIRIQMEVKSTVEKFMNLLNDANRYDDWVYKCEESRYIANDKKTVNSKKEDYYYYLKIDMPFPVKDRDLAVYSYQWEDEKTGIVYSTSKSVPDHIPYSEDYVRIEHFESHWKITPLSGGKIKIDYRSQTNPGGSIPLWVVNLGVTRGPLKTMQSFRALLN